MSTQCDDAHTATSPEIQALQKKDLAKAGVIAVAVAAVVLLVAVLPAEYGVDPTGIGEVFGFTKLSDEPDVTVASGPQTRYTLAADWRVIAVPVAERDGEVRSGQTERVVIPVNVTNLTTLHAVLEWTDDERIQGKVTQPDLFDLRIVAPDGRDSGYVSGTNEPGGSGNITAQLAWRSAPTPEMREDGVFFPTATPDGSGIGDWTISVRLLRAGGSADGASDDMGNTWRLVVSAETFELRVRESAAAGGDQVTLTLPPNGAVEYKFRMDEGAVLDYAWTSTGDVYWDLHAERTGAAADDSTSFRTGTSAGDEGQHTAPFAGRHGWFWHNRGDAPIRITLETRGDYEIIGVS